MTFRYSKLTDSCISQREFPVNFKNKDEVIFKHEAVSEIKSSYLFEINDIFYKGNGLVQVNAKRKLPEQFLLYNFIQRLSNFRYFSYILKQGILGRIETIQDPVVFVADQWSEGYFHWIAEVLPRLVAAKNKLETFPVILPSKFSKLSFVEDSLKRCGLNFRFLDDNNLYKLKRVFFVSHVAVSGNYNDLLIMQTRELLRNKDFNSTQKRFVYISRKNAGKRAILNESEIIPLLKSLNFEIIAAEDLSFDNQRLVFSSTEILVSNHGAGLTNMMFMKQGCKVVELRKANDAVNNCYFSLASALKLHYYYLNCKADNKGENTHNSNLSVDVNELKKLLQSVLAAEIL